MIYFDSEAIYINSCTDARAKIVAINACIDALLTSVLEAAGKAGTEEYMLNDGQTVIKKMYRNPNTVTEMISALRIVRQQYINDINNRSVRLMPGKNFIVDQFGF